MKYTINRNEQFNSYEITFDGKPSEAVRDLLKANGYRWHKLRGIWYGYKDIADKLNSTDEKTPTATATSHEPTDKEQRQLDELKAKRTYDEIKATGTRTPYRDYIRQF